MQGGAHRAVIGVAARAQEVLNEVRPGQGGQEEEGGGEESGGERPVARDGRSSPAGRTGGRCAVRG